MTVRPTLEFENGENSLEVRRVSAHERLNEPFVIDVLARSPNPHIELGAIVGKGAGLAAETTSGLVAWTGLCSFMEIVQPAEDVTGHSTYALRIVPALWLLSQRRNHRIFQHRTTPDVVKAILSEYRIEPREELTGEYPKHEYCVQYGETDLAFVSRLLEEAGISYFFSRQKSGTKAKSVLVLSDALQRGASIAAIDYYDTPNEGQLRGLYVTDVHLGHGIRPGKVTVRDYDFRKPRLALLDSSDLKLAPGEEPEQRYERYHYVPGGSLFEVDGADDALPMADDKSTARHLPKHNKSWAQLRAEAERYEKRRVGFRTNHAGLAPARIFTIEHHPREGLDGQPLMVVETDVFITELDWTLVGTAVFAEAPYRPPVVTPKPRVAGVQSAIVVGPPGREIHTDEFGRVRVRFHWDREGGFDDDATCWLRVSQAWAGTSFGSMHVPRVGQEVLVDFFDGDPDQPVVIGRVFNSTTRVPRKLPEHETQSIWRSATSPQSDGCFNEISFDDAAGKELYFFQAERDLQRLVKRNDTERTGRDRTIVVGKGRVSAIAAGESLQVGKQHLVKMVKVSDLHIADMRDPEVQPLDTFVEMVDRRITLTTGAATIRLDGPDILIDAKGGLRFTTDGRLVVKGSMVYLNVMPGDVQPSADRSVKDAVAKPDRMIGSVRDLFWEPYQDQLERVDQPVALGQEQKIPSECGYLKPGAFKVGVSTTDKHWEGRTGEYEYRLVDDDLSYQFPTESRLEQLLPIYGNEDALEYQATVRGHDVQIIVPKENNSGKALPTVGQLAEALSTLPDRQLRAVEKIVVSPHRSPSDSYWEKKYNTKGFYSKASAGNGRMVTYPTDSWKDQAGTNSTITHETGHIVRDELEKSMDIEKRWKDAIAQDGNAPSKYAQKSWGEDLSETLIGYNLSKGTPCEQHGRKLYPNRYAVLDEVLAPQPRGASRSW